MPVLSKRKNDIDNLTSITFAFQDVSIAFLFGTIGNTHAMKHDAATHNTDAAWRFGKNTFDPQRAACDETLFALANGALGVRGGFEEHPSPSDGTFMAAAFVQSEIHYHERLAGFARRTDTRVPVVEGKRIGIVLGDEHVNLDTCEWLEFERHLDLRSGQLYRRLRLRTPTGHTLEIEARRVVPLNEPALLAIDFRVRSIDYNGPISLVSALETARQAATQSDDPRIGVGAKALTLTGCGSIGEIAWLAQSEPQRRFSLTCGQHHISHTLTAAPPHVSKDYASQRFSAQLMPGGEVGLEKFVVYIHGGNAAQHSAELTQRLYTAANTGFDGFATVQSAALNTFWQQADLSISDQPETERALRFNLFHLMQSATRNGVDGTAAKGLTGEGYEGHCFWDTEIFVLPVMVFTAPQIARAMLQYRYRTLDAARAHAREMNHKTGALYPWRTIDGGECSAHYPSGSAAYHINADIAFGIGLYLDATDDFQFMLDAGAEILFETARIWPQLGHFNPRKQGAFCIHEVTGPDEYTTLVNNNFYTNRMAQQHLQRAVQVWQRLQKESPDALKILADRLQLAAFEVEQWQNIAEHMYLPYDENLGIYAQDDGFLDKPRWPYPAHTRPLLLDYHPLTLNRYQICKQGDVVMALVLAGHAIDLQQKRRCFDYYEAITTHDSTLSASTFGILASETGHADKALEYFNANLRVDLDNLHGNTDHGVHMAALAGSWLGLTWGFSGLRTVNGQLAFSPTLPAAWPGYSFNLRWRDCVLHVAVNADGVHYHLQEGTTLEILHNGQALTLPAATLHPLATPHTSARASFPRPARALIFDLDGVLTDTANLHYQAWKQLADELDIPFDRATNERLKGVDRIASLSIILERASRHYNTEERQMLAERKNGYYLEAIGQLGPQDVFPGVHKVLNDARAAGLKVALASASRNAATLLQKLGIAGHFDAIADASRIQRGKPDPEIFLTAAAALGVPPTQCIGIEDAAAGIEAIHAAGMSAIGIGSAAQLPKADLVLAEIAALEISNIIHSSRFNRTTTANGE